MATNDDLALPSLMEAWRPPSGGKRVLKGSSLRLSAGEGLSAGQGRGAVSGSARERLGRIVRKAPEVMVKVSGRQRGAGHVAAHLGYIGRQGKLEVETGDGERITSVEGLRALALDWQALEARANGKQKGKAHPAQANAADAPALSVMVGGRAGRLILPATVSVLFEEGGEPVSVSLHELSFATATT